MRWCIIEGEKHFNHLIIMSPHFSLTQSDFQSKQRVHQPLFGHADHNHLHHTSASWSSFLCSSTSSPPWINYTYPMVLPEINLSPTRSSREPESGEDFGDKWPGLVVSIFVKTDIRQCDLVESATTGWMDAVGWLAWWTGCAMRWDDDGCNNNNNNNTNNSEESSRYSWKKEYVVTPLLSHPMHLPQNTNTYSGFLAGWLVGLPAGLHGS